MRAEQRSSGDRARLVRRTTVLLAVAQGLLYATLPILLAVGSLAAEDFTGRATAAGVLAATYFASAAVGAFVIGRWMDRAGRRRGLMLGYALVAVGGVVAIAGSAAGSFAALEVSAIPFGIGAGAALLGRLAVADIYPPERRGRAVGLLLAASTVGAVGSPPLIALVQRVGEDAFGFDPLVTPWGLVPLFALGGMVCVFAVRPDPRELAVGGGPADGPRRGPRTLLRLRPFRAAVVAGSIGQAAMIAVMSVAALVVHDHGGGGFAISGTLSLHFVGMFAFMPLVGLALDRWGRRRGLLVGAALSIVGAPVGSLAPEPWVVAVGLFLVGLGWAFAYLGATTVVSDITSPAERGGALGFTDLLVSAASAVGGLGGGVLLDIASFRSLTIVVAVALVPVLLVVAPLRERAPGEFAPAGSG
ncbi:MAG: MFS transporter [Actinomycetota bacterium]